eukprot:gene8941-9680_t
MSFFHTLWLVISNFFRYFQRVTINDPENHIIVITGCDSGFGLMSVYRLLKQGYYMVPLCLTEKGVSELQAYAKANGFNRCLVMRCDVTKEEDVKKVHDKVESLLKSDGKLKLWAVVNNAGIAPSGVTDWMAVDAFRRTFEVNFFAIVIITKMFLHLLKKTKYSRVINICSMAGHGAFPGGAAYCGSKHALEGFTKCLRLELIKWNVYMTNINPGFMKTPFIDIALEAAYRDYEKAPKEITSQYPKKNIDILHDQIKAVEEDPVKVVDCIVDNITYAAPPMNNLPGWQAKAIIWIFWLLPGPLKWLYELAAVYGPGYGPYEEAVKQFQG